ncbi:MAG TPA: L-threonylcarbamoyladenylate synthase [Bacillota bacterium]|nr:L-threonylcarbamoyladenylate synthase [Bacillota bacterium]
MSPDDLCVPGQALAKGAIVAFPTETVYGLGASALLPEAVDQIFLLKGRPADNPLIVHLLSADWLDQVTAAIPPLFWPLYEAFSPGPLTFVMPRHSRIPDSVTAGLSTVAVRFPSQVAARALLQAAGVPVVAPSANLSGRPSPTRARHVLDDFAGRIPYLIDDGPCEVGLESTVIDLTADPPMILRPGKITAAGIREATGIQVSIWTGSLLPDGLDAPPSPGMKYRHYAPGARVRIALPEPGQTIEGSFLSMLERSVQPAGLFLSEATWEKLRGDLPGVKVYTYQGGRDLAAAMHALFDALRTLDQMGVKEIIAEGFAGEEASAYMDRLTKAASEEENFRRILFVCEGNTCRSPMAEAIFNDRYYDRGARASSAGLSAMAGQKMTEQALEALAEWGLEPDQRPSRQIRVRAVREADLIVAMTASQRERLKHFFPDGADKIFAMSDFLEGEDIGDPFGQPLHAYRRVREQLGSAMQKIFDRLILI